MSNYLMINGKRIDLTEEQVKILTEDEKDIWREADYGEEYFYFNGNSGIVEQDSNTRHAFDVIRFRNGNYCLEKEPMERERLDIILYQRLKRFSYMNGWNEDVRDDVSKKKWYIWHDVRYEEWGCDWTCYHKQPMRVYFMSKEIAEQAIEEVVEPFCEEFPEYLGGE